ncbi:hypothetical protein [Parafilimonas sp.]
MLVEEYKEFSTRLPRIVTRAGLNIHDIPFNDFCQIVEEAVREKIKK